MMQSAIARNIAAGIELAKAVKVPTGKKSLGLVQAKAQEGYLDHRPDVIQPARKGSPAEESPIDWSAAPIAAMYPHWDEYIVDRETEEAAR